MRTHPVVHRANEHPQGVDRGADHAAERNHRDHQLALEHAQQDHELADEVGGAGHRQGGEGDDQEQTRQHRCPEGDTAHVTQTLRAAGPGGERSHHEEQGGGHQSVVDHLQQRALCPFGTQREDSQDDEAELGHAGVGHHQPGVGGGEGHGGRPQDRDERDQQHQQLEMHGCVREQGQHDAQEPVGGDLGENAGEHRHRRDRHRPVAVGQPAVERHQRHLHQEGGGEAQEDPLLRAVREGQGAKRGEHEGQRGTVIGGGQHAGGDRRGEHEERADQGVDHELGGGPDSVARPPHPHDEVEGDQHQVEEGDEQGQVLSAERAQHGALGQPEVEVEQPRALPLAQRGPDHRGAEQHHREHDQGDVQSVEPELVVDAERADPGGVGGELQPGVAELEPGEERDRHRDCHQASAGRHSAGQRPRHAGDEQRDRQRQPDEDRKRHQVEEIRK